MMSQNSTNNRFSETQDVFYVRRYECKNVPRNQSRPDEIKDNTSDIDAKRHVIYYKDNSSYQLALFLPRASYCKVLSFSFCFVSKIAALTT